RVVLCPQTPVPNVFQNAAAHAAAPEAKTAARCPRQRLYGIRFYRCQRADTVAAEIAFIVKSARVAEIARQMQFCRQAYAVPIRQMGKAWNFIALGIFFCLARKRSRTYAHGLSKLNTV